MTAYHLFEARDILLCEDSNCELTHYASLTEAQNAVSGVPTLTPVNDALLDKILKKAKLRESWPENLQQFLDNHKTKLPKKPTSMQHQVICLFAENLGRGFNRAHLTRFGASLNRPSGDAIQWANKIERTGLRLHKAGSSSAPFYGFASLEFSDRYLAKDQDTTTETGRAAAEERLRRYFHDLGNGRFERGHKDPREELTDDNLVMQPQEINRSYRDTHIFDDNGLPAKLNPDVFAANPLRFYNKKDLQLILEGIKKVLE